MEKALEIRNLKKEYGTDGNQTKALQGLSFAVDKGEFVAIMGRSGSGKTTLLNIIATIDKKSSGIVKISGIDIDSLNKKNLSDFRKRELGFIFQDFSLLDTMNSYDNISLPLCIQKIGRREIDSRVREVSSLLDIDKILYKYPYECSGGEKQRIASARALVGHPSLVLADEPTGSLDSRSSKSLLTALSEVNKKEKASILMVTHDAFAASFATRVIFLKDGLVDGEIQKDEDNQKEFFERVSIASRKEEEN